MNDDEDFAEVERQGIEAHSRALCSRVMTAIIASDIWAEILSVHRDEIDGVTEMALMIEHKRVTVRVSARPVD